MTTDRSMYAWFAATARRHPDAVALEVADTAYTYARLRELTERLARQLIAEAGGAPPARVGLLAGRTLTAYAGYLAVQRLGATVVPLGTGFPAARNAAIAEAAALDLVLAEPGSDTDGLPVPALTADPAALPPAGEAALPETAPDPEDIAYILFTSGSTGTPKGVPVRHRNVAAYLTHVIDRYGLGAGDRLSQTFDLTFDLSVFDLFAAWGSGATLVVPHDHDLLAPVRYVTRERITHWFSVPSVVSFAMRLRNLAPGSMPTLRRSLFCGEPLTAAQARAWQAAAPGSVLENLYGPTELTLSCTQYRFGAAAELGEGETVPIGEPYPGLEALVIDDDGHPATEGELCVRGAQRFPGYLDPRDNAGRFVEHTEGRATVVADCQVPGEELWYRTGDRVRHDTTHGLIHLGRLDQQVKVRGYRVELGEIEAVLRSRPGVRDAIVVAVPGPRGESKLLAAFTGGTGETGGTAEPGPLLDAVRDRLPGYMVPDALTRFESFPLNANGKIDRRAIGRALAPAPRPAARPRVKRAALDATDTDTTGGGPLIHDLLDEAVAQVPDAPAVRDAAGAWTYRELAAHSHAFAAWLRDQGIGRGDRVLLQLPSSREMVAMFHGTARRGAVFIPLNPAMKPFHLRSVVRDAEPKLVIGNAATAEQLRGIADAPVHDLADVWAEVRKGYEAGARPEPEPVEPDDLASLIYTSGSTAAPKAVISPHRQVTFATRALTEALGYRPDDVVFCRFPMSWDYGLYKVLMTCAARCAIVLADGESDFVLLKRMRETGVTVVPIVPSLATMIVSLARRDRGEPPPVRMFTNTGAALPQATIDALRAHFPGARVVRQYGQTEAKRITVMPPEEDTERPDSVGLPLPGTRVLVLDPDGRPVPTGEVGEIVAAGPHVMGGYWRNPEVTARTFRPDPETGELRLHTGDYGSLDADGYLYFEGRRDDMFKRKGFRMSTLEIESAAMDIPGVRAAAALPPNDRHDLALFVESDLDAQTVTDELMQRLDHTRIPAVCRVLTEFPFTLHGKNARQELEALLEKKDET